MNINFKVISLSRLGIKPDSTAPEADALTTRPHELWKFGSDFTDVITKDETRWQNILQQVEAVRLAYRTSSKNFFRFTKDI